MGRRLIPIPNIAPRAPHSPDMLPCDFFVFSRLKEPLRETRLESFELTEQNPKEAPREMKMFSRLN